MTKYERKLMTRPHRDTATKSGQCRSKLRWCPAHQPDDDDSTGVAAGYKVVAGGLYNQTVRINRGACLCVSVVLVSGALSIYYLPVLIMVGTSTNKDMAKRQPADAGDSTYCPGRDVNRRGKRWKAYVGG